MKASGMIQISSDSVSLLQRKCFNVLLVNAFRDIESKSTHIIRISDIRYALNDHDIVKIKTSIKKLMTTVVEMNTLRSRDKTIWEASTLLADAAIRGDDLHYSYGPLLREKLMNPATYARINLAIQRQFRTKYALALYELATDHYIAAKGSGHTPFIELHDLRKLLGCADDSIYQEYRYFRQRVLNKSIKEINEKTDLYIEIKQKKRRQAVEAIQFLIATNERSGMLAKMCAPKQAEMPLAPGGMLHTRIMREYGLTETQASDIVSNNDPQKIEDILIYVARQQTAGKVENLAAYTMSAFRDNYILPTPAPVREQASDNGSQVVSSLKEGTLIQLDDGTVYAVEEGDFIRIEGRGIITRGEIIRELKAGKFKVVAADAVSEYLAPDPNEDQAKQTTKPKARKSRKDLHEAEE